MKKIACAVIGAIATLAAGNAAASPDWSKVAPVKLTLFYPGQSSLEWVMDRAEHSAVPDIVEKNRSCAKCHTGDANEVGDKIVKGQPVGHKKASIEPKPIPGKAGHVPALLQVAHDGNKIWFRIEWESPKPAGAKMDAKNEVKATIMFDGGGTVDGLLMQMQADLLGCAVRVAPAAETTALGAARLAALGAGIALQTAADDGRLYLPSGASGDALIAQWRAALHATLDHVQQR